MLNIRLVLRLVAEINRNQQASADRILAARETKTVFANNLYMKMAQG